MSILKNYSLVTIALHTGNFKDAIAYESKGISAFFPHVFMYYIMHKIPWYIYSFSKVHTYDFSYLLETKIEKSIKFNIF